MDDMILADYQMRKVKDALSQRFNRCKVQHCTNS